MLRKLAPQLPSLVVSIVALVVAGGGGALAATLTISGSEIEAGTITTHQLSPSVLKLLDEHKKGPAGTTGLPGATGATGATGAVGATGATGAPGLNGLDGVASSTAYVSTPIDAAIGATVEASAVCPVGTVVTGGGFFSSVATIAASGQTGPASGNANGWFAIFTNNSGIALTDLEVYVTCAS
jgi:hypothetical protein